MDKKTQGTYIKQLLETEIAIKRGDVVKLKELNKSIAHKCKLRKCMQMEANPFRKSNAVIIACKANQVKALEFLLSSESRILENSSGVILPTTEDETHHNAFYYAIRSGDTELIEILVSRWPKKYFKNRPQELDEIISSAYEELKVNNVFLSNDTKIFIEKQIIALRFCMSIPVRQNNANDYIKITKERAEMVIETVNDIKNEYSSVQKIDELCIYKMKFVARNISVLKQKLKSTYDRLPWEEIEFCLIVFISNHSTKKKINLYCNDGLEYDKIISHLEHFVKKLESEIKNLKASRISELTVPVKQKRSLVVDKIIRKCPEFESLYKHYLQLRDLYSLEIISETLKLELDADGKEREGKILITRILQVLGEYMKNTLQSPNLSDGTCNLLLGLLPKAAKKLILTLRDSISHADSLFKRTNIENNMEDVFFHGILKNLRGIGYVVNDMIQTKKCSILSSLVNQINNVQTVEEFNKMKNLVRDNFNLDDNFEVLLISRIKNLVKELSAAIPDQSAYEKQLFQLINNECHSIEQVLKESNKQRSFVIRCLKLFAKNKYEGEMSWKDFSNSKIFKQELKMPQVCNSSTFMNIGTQVKNILESVGARTLPSNVKRIAYRIAAMIPNSEVKWIEDLEHKLNNEENSVTLNCTYSFTRENYTKELNNKREELKRILNTHRSKAQELCAFFDVYNRDKKLQCVVEMLVLDIMSIMTALNPKHFGRDFLFVDDICPVLVGKCLRNHLAHNNELVTLLLDDPNRMILLNALKLIEELDGNEKCQRHVLEDISNVKRMHENYVRILQTKLQAFTACENGKIESLKMNIADGADPNSRCREGHGILYFATKGGNIDLLLFLLQFDQNLSLTVSELEVAISNDRKNIAEYIVSKIGMPVGGEEPNESSLLHIAAKNGNEDILKFLIQNKSDPKRYDAIGMPIHTAATVNQKRIVEYLLKNGLNSIDDKSKGGFSLLHIAVDFGHIEMVKYLLELGAYVNAKADNDYSTPLHIATLRGSLSMVQLLVLKGADVNARILNGLSPLHSATENNCVDIVSFLLEHNVIVDAAQIICKTTSLHIACKSGYKSIVELLLKKGADVNVRTADGNTPMHLAVFWGHSEIFSTLLQYGCDILAKTNAQWTLLHYVARCGKVEMVDKIIKNCNVNVKTVDDVTPLHVAASQGYARMVDFLINNGALIDSRDIDGQTPLHVAASKNYIEVIKKLIQNGAEIDVKNNFNMSPLCLAIIENHYDAITLLIQYGAAIIYEQSSAMDFSPLNLAITKGNINVVELMVSKRSVDHKYLGSHAAHLAVIFEHNDILKFFITNGDLKNICENGYKLLKAAVSKNNKDIVKLLIASGALANNQQIDELLFETVKAGHADIVDHLLRKCDSIDKFFDHGEPLLIRAAQTGYMKTFKNVLQKCKNIDVAWKQGTTALHVAALLGYKEMVEVLLDKGANVNVECDDGTPLHLAAAHNDDAKIVELLLSRGANINFEDKKKRTAVQLAIYNNKLEIVKTFISSGKCFINQQETVDGLTLLHIAAQNGYMDIIRYLFDQGADININNRHNSKPIHHAAREGHIEVIKFFISKGSPLNETGYNDRTLLHYATMKDHIKVVEYLIGENANLNAQTSEGLTTLHYCVLFGFKEIAKMLLNHGAIYNVADKRNKKPSDMFVEREYYMGDKININEQTSEEIAVMLTTTDKLFKAVKRNDVLEAHRCIREGAFINAKDNRGNMLLHHASWKGYVKIVEVLLNAMPNVNACMQDGSTPLHYSAKFSHPDVVIMLLSHGAMYNLRNNSKAKPFDLATEKSIKDILKFIDDQFKYISRGSRQVIEELGRIKDYKTLRAIVNARNESNKSFIMTAKLVNFSKLEELTEVLFEDLFVLMDMAYKLSIKENYNKALEIYRSVLEQLNVKLGPNNFLLINVKRKIGEVLFKQHKYEESLQILTEVRDLQTEFLGSDHVDAMNTRGTIALVFHRQGKNKEALDIYKQIYPKQKKVLAPTSEYFLNTLLHMALVLRAMGMNEEALKLNKEHYEVCRKTKGENHSLTLYAKNNIALILSSMGQHDKAIKMFEEVYVIRKLFLGPHHSDTLRPLHNIASVYMSTARYDDAIKRFEKVFEIQKNVFGLQHLDTLNTQFNIGNTLFKRSNIKDALKVLKEYLTNAKYVLGPNNPEVVTAKAIIESINTCLKMDDSNVVLDRLNDLQRNLNAAAGNGSEQAVTDLINSGVNVNYVDEDGRSALYYAVHNGKLKIVQTLLEHSANVFEITNKRNTLLHAAAAKGYHEIMELLLQYAEEKKRIQLCEIINTKTLSTGSTALHVAAEKGFYEVVQSLLQRGAAYDIRNSEGLKPSDISRNEAITCLFAFIDNIFKNALSGNAKSLITKLESGQPDQVQAVERTRNIQGLTLLQAVLLNCEKNIALHLVNKLRHK